MSRFFTFSSVVALGLSVSSASAAPRAKPDASAIREAIGDSTAASPADRYVSARALSHYMTAIIARTDGDFATEIAELRLAALYDAENPHAQYELSREYLRLGDLKAARLAATDALALDPNHAPTLALIGRLELQSGNAERAAATLRRATALNPSEAEPTALLIDALLATGAPTAASTAADKLSRMVTENSLAPVRETVAGSLAHVAESLARDGRNDLAERFYLRAAELEPQNPERQIALARFYELRDRAGDAADCYARATGLSLERTPSALEAARLYLKADKPLRAAGYIPMLATDPKGSVPLLRLGQMLEDGGARDEAIRSYQAAAKASAGWGEPLVRAGRLLESQDRFAEAAACYRDVSESDEAREESQVRAELCDLRLVDPRKHEGELLTRLRSLTTRSPALPDAFDLLARTLASSHAHLTEAETVARDALARWPERAESLQTFGRVLLAQGKAEAFEVLEKAAGLLASRPEVQLDLAEAALMAGHADAASAAITKAQSLLQGVDRKEPRQRLLALAAKLPGAAPTRRGSLQATRPH